MTLAIWSQAPDVPTTVCEDARLDGGGAGLGYPLGNAKGQAGWDMGLQFKDLAHLADRLSRAPAATPSHTCGNWVRRCAPIQRGQVTRLGTHAHGLPGRIYFGGRGQKALDETNIDDFAADLEAIGRSLDSRASVLVMGCLAGAGKPGTKLLERLSGHYWPGRTVVAFATIGFVSGGDMLRRGEFCAEPGMRDTDNRSPALSWAQQQADYGPIWKDLKRLPWASETSPHAKVAVDGRVVRGENL
jgi:hypothetical protein